ncbi:zinc finger MYM-type protein 1-like [Belonocnema kinseyi]|uniref:zinc finger MYM-type protein 1-like n=1 Tax=Belonocnema kinseyi TaxID=2817044 RepID=UPI00143D2EAA|nr:zinc finger MYM-type protein 1-like [Belonocnema kinseyi]
MSDGRKRLSGYEYRKKAAEKKRKLEDVITKFAKLDSFVKKKEKQCESTNLESLSTKTTSKDNNITSVDHDFIANRDTSDIKLRIEKEDDETKSFLSNDPVTWPISDSTRDYIALHGWIQNEKADFTSSRKLYSDGSMRYLSKNVFKRKLLNGEEVHRPWIVFSESKGSLFCVACQINEKLTSKFEKETAYWRNVVRRVVSATKYLASRGLPFRGTDKKFGSENNGNFFMLIEFLSEFDPLMAKHVNDFGNKGSGSKSYLSKTIYEEFIEIMAREVLKNIVSEEKNAKYFSIMVDSTPDIAHIDQLSFVLRYVRDNGQPVERFLLFIDNVGHKAKDVADAVFDTLEHYGINIAYCRGQSYDNAKNMSGQYSSLQARIKLLNELAEWNPCSGHSLNLIEVHAVGSCSEASNFFAIVQAVYNFFSASTHRWAILKRCAQEKCLTLKSLSTTRW